jgi:hypothetical protein
MNLSLIVTVYSEKGDYLATARTRTQLESLIKVPLFSRNESGKWNVEDPDAPNSLNDIDEVSAGFRSNTLLSCRLVDLETYVDPFKLA